MVSSQSIVLLIAAVLFVVMCAVTEARNLQYEFEDQALPDAFRYAQWAGEVPHKRVPSAGDMMVRFGKRTV